MALAVPRLKPMVRLVLVVQVSYTAVEEKGLFVHTVVHGVGLAQSESSGRAQHVASHQRTREIYNA
jgi:hypothetical protein